MSHLKDYSDNRNKQWCIHCHTILQNEIITRDHVPSKALLKIPLPSNLPVVNICLECNNKYSPDEEFLMVFLEVVITGSTNPENIKDPKIKKILQENVPLRKRIEKFRREKITPTGQIQTFWEPEFEAITNVLLKNARGHVMYELGEPMLDEPSAIIIKPAMQMTFKERNIFETGEDMNSLWPEVGSRMMSRIIEGSIVNGGWVVVQDGAYRYSVTQDGGIRVKSVIHDYLTTEILW